VALLTILPLPGIGRLRGEAGVPTASPRLQASEQSAPACQPAPLAARAAAVLVAGMPGTQRPSDPLASSLPRLGVGGVLLTDGNVRSREQVRALTAALRARSPRPLLVTTDEEGGEVSSFRSILGPSGPASTTGAEPAAKLTDRGQTLGRILRDLGITGDLAPVADVSDPGGSSIGSRSFSGDPATASRDALAVARGLSAAGVVPAVKHFPGLGRARDDTHRSIASVTADRADLARRDLRPFVDAVGAGIPIVMVGHASYPALGIAGQPASMSPAAYRLLRSLGFQGVAITDSLGMGAVNLRYDYPQAAVRALQAGADALLFTDGRQAQRMRDAIVRAVRDGQLPEARLDEAAARVTALSGGNAPNLTCRDASLPALR
jgi:beta-N-acetylhexosaminidase